MFSDTPLAPAFESQPEYVSRIDIGPAVAVFLGRPGFNDHILDISKANWPSWSSAVSSALAVAGLKGYITGAVPHPGDSHPFSQTNWAHNDESVQGFLMSFVSQNDDLACGGATTASEIWNILKHRHESCTTVTNAAMVVNLQGVMNVRFNKFESISDTIKEIEEMVHHIYLNNPLPKDPFLCFCLLNAMRDSYPLDYESLNGRLEDEDFNSSMIIGTLLAKMKEGEEARKEIEAAVVREKLAALEAKEAEERQGDNQLEFDMEKEDGATTPNEPEISSIPGWFPEEPPNTVREAPVSLGLGPELRAPPIQTITTDSIIRPLVESRGSSYKLCAAQEEPKTSDSDEVDISDVSPAPFSAPGSPALEKRMPTSIQAVGQKPNKEESNGHPEGEGEVWSFIDNLRRRSTEFYKSLVHPPGPHTRESMDWREFEKIMNDLGFESSSDSDSESSVRFDPPHEASEPIFFAKSSKLDQDTLKQYGKELKEHYGLDGELLLHPEDD